MGGREQREGVKVKNIEGFAKERERERCEGDPRGFRDYKFKWTTVKKESEE